MKIRKKFASNGHTIKNVHSIDFLISVTLEYQWKKMLQLNSMKCQMNLKNKNIFSRKNQPTKSACRWVRTGERASVVFSHSFALADVWIIVSQCRCDILDNTIIVHATNHYHRPTSQIVGACKKCECVWKWIHKRRI